MSKYKKKLSHSLYSSTKKLKILEFLLLAVCQQNYLFISTPGSQSLPQYGSNTLVNVYLKISQPYTFTVLQHKIRELSIHSYYMSLTKCIEIEINVLVSLSITLSYYYLYCYYKLLFVLSNL